jgi:predicted ATPase
LDNFERVLSVSQDVVDLLGAAPELCVLITSQVPLRLSIERCVPVAALDDSAAVALLRRVAGRGGVGLTEDGRALREVVQLLDGLPLAIELAAARLGVLTARQLHERLCASTSWLTDSRRDRPERQRAVATAVDWTLGSFDADTQSLFRRLGAFAGPVGLHDIERVAGEDGLDVLDALEQLLDVALVRRVEAGDGLVRFGLPEALRQLASSQLDAASDDVRWRRAHAQYELMLAWSARFGNMSAGADYPAATSAHAEAVASLRWARQAGEPTATRLAAAMVMRQVYLGRIREARAALGPLLSSATGDPAIDALAHLAHSYLLMVHGDLANAHHAVQRGLASAPDAPTLTFGYCALGFLHSSAGRFRVGIRECARATECAAGVGPVAMGYALGREAQAYLAAGSLDVAAKRIAQAHRVGRPVDLKLLWHNHAIYGDLALKRGQVREALGHYVDSLVGAEARQDRMQALFDLHGAAAALAAGRCYSEAFEVEGLAEGLRDEMSHDIAPPLKPYFGEHVQAAQDHVSSDAVVRFRGLGRVHPAARRVARACELAARAADAPLASA